MGDHKPSISHLESAKNKVNSSPKKNCDDDIVRNKIRIYKKTQSKMKWNSSKSIWDLSVIRQLAKTTTWDLRQFLYTFFKEENPNQSLFFYCPHFRLFLNREIDLKKDKRLTPKCTMYYTMCAVKLFFP